MEKLLIDMMMETEYVVPLFEACANFRLKLGFDSSKKEWMPSGLAMILAHKPT
jgi:hypothetical protein